MAGALSRNAASTPEFKPTKIKVEQVEAIRRYPAKPKGEAEGRKPLAECGKCGISHHVSETCPAQGKTCAKCGRLHHFARVCRGGAPPNRSGFKRNKRPQLRHLSLEEPEEVYHTHQEGRPTPRTHDEEEEDIFTISFTGRENTKKRPPPICNVNIEGVEITALIDTGASVNVMDEIQFEKLVPPPTVMPTAARIYTYGGTTPLPLKGVIHVEITSEDRSTTAKFHVTEGWTGTLLSCHTAEDLGLVFFAHQVHDTHAENILEEFPQLFRGLGCLKGRKVKLHINKSVQPVALRHRRVPFHLRPAVEKELEQLEKLGVIERVSGPTPWVSPLVIAPKPKQPGAIRLCVDLRLPNKAISRERYITPTID